MRDNCDEKDNREGWAMNMRRTVRFAMAAVVAALPLALAACGGDDDGNSGAGGGSGAGGDGTPTLVSVAPGPKRIVQDNLAFKPNTLAVYQGEKITFTNDESTIHTVTINGKNESGTMKKGDVFEFTPDVPGRFAVTCDFHPQMKATIVVVPTPTTAP
jgi:plastocyanin